MDVNNPLKMVLIGIDPYPYVTILSCTMAYGLGEVQNMYCDYASMHVATYRCRLLICLICIYIYINYKGVQTHWLYYETSLPNQDGGNTRIPASGSQPGLHSGNST